MLSKPHPPPSLAALVLPSTFASRIGEIPDSIRITSAKDWEWVVIQTCNSSLARTINFFPRR